MPDTRTAVLATLSLYDALGVPLTLMDIHGRLISPSRFGGRPGAPSVGEVARSLDSLIALKQIYAGDGFYFLTPSWRALQHRFLERQKVAAAKWQRLVGLAGILARVPYVRAVFGAGSLALESADPSSDLDVFLIVRGGRIFTARLLVSLVTSLMGARRTKHDRVAPDKLCMNHWIADDRLTLRHRSLFTAHAYANMVPVFSRHESADRFVAANPWVSHWRAQPIVHVPLRRSVAENGLREQMVSAAERLMDKFVIPWSEPLARAWQQRRIRNNPLTHEKGGRVIASDAELEFHPRSVEARILARYQATLAKAGIAASPEADSGLTR